MFHISIFAVRVRLTLCSTEYGNGFRNNAMLTHGREPDESGGPQKCRLITKRDLREPRASYLHPSNHQRKPLLPQLGGRPTHIDSFDDFPDPEGGWWCCSTDSNLRPPGPELQKANPKCLIQCRLGFRKPFFLRSLNEP